MIEGERFRAKVPWSNSRLGNISRRVLFLSNGHYQLVAGGIYYREAPGETARG
jgi:hypothetical protein